MSGEASIAIDLGGTKCAGAIVQRKKILSRCVRRLDGAGGDEVYSIIIQVITSLIESSSGSEFKGIGIAVPGIARSNGMVWAPNIPGWDDYQLLEKLSADFELPVFINSDRSCAIRGEAWAGVAESCGHAVYVAFGTGIGAGIMIDGVILEGSQNIAGAIGWLALDGEFKQGYETYGNFEYNASGDGLTRVANDLLSHPVNTSQSGPSSEEILKAFDRGEQFALDTINNAINYWGRGVANLISIFNPEIVIMGGGLFGPAVRFIPQISAEARKWAQPVSFSHCSIQPSKLGNDALLYGAAKLVMDHA